MSSGSTSSPAAAFQTFGFGVLRQFFDPRPLAAEIDRAMHEGLVSRVSTTEKIHFEYVPMMTTQTPTSLSLLDRIEAVAADLLGGSVLPTRAKGVRYSGNTPWHSDSISPLASARFLTYLEPLGVEDGALRILPGSHHPEFRDALRRLGIDGTADPSVPAHVVATEPGDLILLDEHLFHASFGGRTRRQWRVDFVKAPRECRGRGSHEVVFCSSLSARLGWRLRRRSLSELWTRLARLESSSRRTTRSTRRVRASGRAGSIHTIQAAINK